jgi:hypothetical protein
MTDARDGTMTSVTGDLPPAQAQALSIVPAGWADMPRLGVHEAILYALKDRGLVETRWSKGNVRQWRRVTQEQ